MRRIFFATIILLLGALFNQATCQTGGSIIKGKITDSDGNPLPGAGITLENTFIGTHSGNDGGYIIAGLHDGNIRIKFSFIGFETQYREISLKGESVIDIVLSGRSFVTEEVFVSATRAGENAPLAYSSVSKETLSRNNSAQDIPYLIGYTPSVVVSSDAGTGIGYTNINIRGSDVKRINVTIDGVPVNDAESHGVWWVDLPDIASSADNVQIQRGVGTSTNGAGAFGATINFQTAGLNREPYAMLSKSYGSFNTSKNTLSLGTGLIKNKFAFDARLSDIYSDGYIDRAFSDLKSYYVSGTLYAGAGILKLVVFSGTEHTYQAWSGVPKDSLKTNRTYNPYNYKNETDNYWQDNYQIHYSKKLSVNLTGNVALHYTHGKGYYENLKSDKKFSSFNLPDAVFNSETLTSSDFIVQKWLVNDFYGITYSFNYNLKNLNIVLGGGWNQYLGDHFGDIIWARNVTFPGEKFRYYSGTGDKKDLNTYLKTNLAVTSKLNIFTDLQLRNIDYKIGGYNDDLNFVGQKHLYNFFNPKAGLFYSINDKQKGYLSFGISQREPDRSNFTDADPGRTPVPEKLFDIEGGYEFTGNSFQFRGNLFYMNYKDQLIMTGEINNVGAPVMTNVPKSYRNGIELEAGVLILKTLKWNGNLTLSRNIIPEYIDYTDNWDTWGQEKTVLNDKTISFSPSVIAGSVISYDFLKHYNLGITTKYVGKQYLDNTESADRMLDGYFVQNITLQYVVKDKFFREFSGQLIINNMFNRMYESNGWVYKYLEGGILKTMDGYFPQAGMNFFVKVDIKF
jgi:iron complex outermembrane recepter protein